MSRSDRDSSRRNRAIPANADSGVASDGLAGTLAPSTTAPDTDARQTSDLHTHFGNSEVAGALDGEWSGGMGPLMADGLDFAAGGMGASEDVGVSPSNTVMLRAMRDAFQATNYDAGDPILRSLRPSGGEKLPGEVRAKFEAAMGHDLDHVRIHRDATAASQSDALNAFAFTIGSHIWFGGGRFDPNSVRGQQLLAHWLVVGRGEINVGDALQIILEVSRGTPPCIVDQLIRHAERAGLQLRVNTADRIDRNDAINSGFPQRPEVCPVIDPMRRHPMRMTMPRQKADRLPVNTATDNRRRRRTPRCLNQLFTLDFQTIQGTEAGTTDNTPNPAHASPSCSSRTESRGRPSAS